ncbi:Transposase [Roseibium aggregatum]|uniref:Transposase n=1 Tax=Roseibium aggregatum TaxID=187304 RepID=A0A0M6YCJ4_9HYPH|nr:Transposase [Roseibium aggregatum]
MANWVFTELSDLGLPMVCIDARQAHAVLSQMHNKTNANDAAMLAELARTDFYRKVEVKSRIALERCALLKAHEVAVKSRVNVENTIRGLLASFGLRLPKHLQTYEERGPALMKNRPALANSILPLLELRTTALRQAAELTKGHCQLILVCEHYCPFWTDFRRSSQRCSLPICRMHLPLNAGMRRPTGCIALAGRSC